MFSGLEELKEVSLKDNRDAFKSKTATLYLPCSNLKINCSNLKINL